MADDASAASRELMQLKVEISTFRTSWDNCGLMADYLADIVSEGSSDPVRSSHFISGALNEMLEEVFRSAPAYGHLACEVASSPASHSLALTFPNHGEIAAAYKKVSAIIAEGRSLHEYLADLQRDNAGPKFVLLGLAINYKAAISVTDCVNDTVRVVLDLPIEGGTV
jgi:hypothetical protein